MKTTKTHVYFWGGPYSQWFKSPFTENGKIFPTAEHYMMYHKALLFDPSKADQVFNIKDPKQVKALGRSLKNFNKDVWDANCMKIVTQGNYLKFTQNKTLLKQMLSDNPKMLVEASPVDTIWGVGLHFDDPLILNKANWRGENKLGQCLVQAREQIKKEKALKITKNLVIENLCVYNEKGRLHIIDIKDGMFSVDPRTDGTIIPTQPLQSVYIDSNEIVLTGTNNKEYIYQCLNSQD